MENKYYTPDITEFRIGFEFEVITIEPNILNEDITDIPWRQEVCEWLSLDIICDDWEHEKETFHNLYRVKYLDKADIEELGFTIIIEDNRKYKAVKEGCTILIGGDMYTSIYHTVEGYSDTALFRGEIKNKSELKMILKMLGIC